MLSLPPDSDPSFRDSVEPFFGPVIPSNLVPVKDEKYVHSLIQGCKVSYQVECHLDSSAIAEPLAKISDIATLNKFIV